MTTLDHLNQPLLEIRSSSTAAMACFCEALAGNLQIRGLVFETRIANAVAGHLRKLDAETQSLKVETEGLDEVIQLLEYRARNQAGF